MVSGGIQRIFWGRCPNVYPTCAGSFFPRPVLTVLTGAAGSSSPALSDSPACCCRYALAIPTAKARPHQQTGESERPAEVEPAAPRKTGTTRRARECAGRGNRQRVAGRRREGRDTKQNAAT